MLCELGRDVIRIVSAKVFHRQCKVYAMSNSQSVLSARQLVEGQ